MGSLPKSAAERLGLGFRKTSRSQFPLLLLFFSSLFSLTIWAFAFANQNLQGRLTMCAPRGPLRLPPQAFRPSLINEPLMEAVELRRGAKASCWQRAGNEKTILKKSGQKRFQKPWEKTGCNVESNFPGYPCTTGYHVPPRVPMYHP